MPTTTRGIWTPDAGDEYALTTDLAATASSVDNAITDAVAPLDNRLDDLETGKFVSVPGITALNSFTLGPGTRAAKIGNMVILHIEATRSTNSGGVASVNFAQLPASIRPSSPITDLFVASQGTGAPVPATVVINTDGTVRNYTASSTNGLISGSLIYGV